MTQVFDAPQRQRALDTGTSFIVQAPAGSGKTELLTQRYLALLAKVDQPEAVLAITFTRKAASEMRERIIHALNKAKHSSQPANEPDHTSWRLAKQVLNSDERLQWQLLKNPQRLQIQTIDSFNSTLVKRMPSLSGLGADIKTVEDAESLYQMAAERTLGLLDDDDHGDAVANYLLHLDGNRTRAQTLLIEMLKCRDQWTSRINKQGFEVEFRQYIEDSLVKVIEDEMSDLHDMLNQSEIGRINTLANYALEILRASGVDTYFKAKYHSDESYTLESLSLANVNDWRDISAWLLKAGNKALLASFNKTRGFPAVSDGVGDDEKALFKERKAQITELAQELIPREAFFTRVSQLPSPEFTESEWQHLSDLIRCLKLALGQLRLIFTERDRLDFQEVAIRASEALDIENTDLALIMDYQIQHILIDEFQDTSQSQNILLEKLIKEWQPNDGRTLFLVGDPMQSIYRFREADVGLFLQAVQNGIGNIKLEALKLRVNFRSSHTIVNWVNDHFRRILPEQQDIYRGAVTYSESDAFHIEQPGDVSCLFFEDKAQEADYIAQTVSTQFHADQDTNIAVLVRSRNHLLHILPELQARNIPFQATEIESLASRPVISDLKMLLRALQDPTDRVAWLAILRAPWCGLMLKDLEVIAGHSGSQIIANADNELICTQLSADGIARLQTLLATIKPWLAQVRSRTITDTLEGLWLSLDGPVYLQSRSDLDAAQMFFSMLSDISIAGQMVVSNDLNYALERLYAPPDPEADARVQIMTIHKSKGLQFDTVIVPSIGARGANDSNTLLRWMTTADGLLMSPMSINEQDDRLNYNYLKDIHSERGEQERKRLLYVACTRAKSKLILTTSHTLKEGELKPSHNSLLSDLMPTLNEPLDWPMGNPTSEDEMTEVSAAENETTSDNRLYRRATTDNYLSRALIQNTPSMQIPMNPSGLDDFPNASLYRRAVGIVVHRWLEIVADNISSWSIADIEQRTELISQLLAAEGVNQSELSKGVSEVIEHLRLTLDCPTGRQILQRYEESASELAIERKEDPQVKYYIIDRTYVDDDGTRWIVDYKTAHKDNLPLDEFLLAQKALYQKQLENYAELLHQLKPEPIKLMLYFTLYQRPIIWDWN